MLLGDFMVHKAVSDTGPILHLYEIDLLKVLDNKLVDVVMNNRIGNLKIKPGFDGVYGQIILNDN